MLWQKGERSRQIFQAVSFYIPFLSMRTYRSIYLPVIELSDDCKNVRCKLCGTLRGNNGGWIRKESLTYHLKSDAHAYSVRAQQDRESVQTAREESMREESATEERMDFAILSSATKPSVTVKTGLTRPSLQEEEMWDNYVLSNETFYAGTDHAMNAAQQMKRLEQEATNFSLWCDVDCIPENYSTNSEQLLDELEQEDILTELLKSTRPFSFLTVSCKK